MRGCLTKAIGSGMLLAAAALFGESCASQDAGPYAPKYGDWTSSRLWGGGYVQNVVLCPSDPKRCYAYIDMAGLYRSDDRGETWRMLHGVLKDREIEIRGLLVDPRDADKIVIATGNPSVSTGILTSDDGGASFKRVLKAPFDGNGSFRDAGFVLDRDAKNPDHMLAASIGDGIWESRDNGQAWICLGAKGLFPTDLRFDIRNPKRIWVCSQNWTGYPHGKKSSFKAAFLRSDDGGENWKTLSEESPTELLQDPDDPSRLLGIFDERLVKLSLDGGETWTELSKGLPVVEKRKEKDYCSRNRFCALAAGPGFILTASANGDFYRLDKGQSVWQEISRSSVDSNGWWANVDGKNGQWSHFGKALGSIVVDPADPAHWYLTDWFAVYQTFDSGKTWKATIQGMAQTVVHAVASDPLNPKIVHLGMADNGYFRSDDGGLSFKQNTDGIGCNVKCLACASEFPGVVYATGSSSWKCDTLYVNDKSGTGHWRKAACKGLPDKESHFFDSIAIDPKDSKRVVAGVSGSPKQGEGGVYESLDGGESWSWIGAGLPEGKGFFHDSIWWIGREIALSKDGSMVCFSNSRRKVFSWDKASKTWIKAEFQQGQPLDVAADPFKPGRFAIGAIGGGVFVSEDGGKTWAKSLDGTAGQVCFDSAVEGRMAASSEDGVFLSEDGGKTWKALDKGLPDRRFKNSGAFSGSRLLVGSGASGAFWTELGR